MPDALPWLAISALGLLAVIIVSPAMDVFPDFVAQQSSNNSEAVSFLALAIALLQCNSRPRLGLAWHRSGTLAPPSFCLRMARIWLYVNRDERIQAYLGQSKKVSTSVSTSFSGGELHISPVR